MHLGKVLYREKYIKVYGNVDNIYTIIDLIHLYSKPTYIRLIAYASIGFQNASKRHFLVINGIHIGYT